MSTINISGKIVYRPGLWGVNVPAASVTVKIYDIDLPGQGSGDDLIWSGTTDANGNFQGTSSEWQDTVQPPNIWVPSYIKAEGRWVEGHWEGSGLTRHWVPAHWEPVMVDGHWETPPRIPDSLDVLALKAVITTASGNRQDYFPFINNAPVPIVLPWGPPQITKDERGLIAFTSVVNNGIQQWRPLYSFLEASGSLLVDSILKPKYKTVHNIIGNQCTRQEFLSKLQNLGADFNIRAIDVILSLHGSDNKLWFSEGSTQMSALCAQIQALNIRDKLRILYSTACYGSSHADEFDSSGFDAIAGAVAINANSPAEYPTVLTLWGAGLSFSDAIAAGENASTRVPLDQIATAAGFTPVDSHKIIRGNGTLNINSIGS